MALFLSKNDVRKLLREELAAIKQQLTTHNEQLTNIHMKLSELPAAISTAVEPFRGLPTQLEKVKQEIIAAIQEDNSDPELPQNVVDALAGLTALGTSVKAGVDAVDALIADAPPPPNG